MGAQSTPAALAHAIAEARARRPQGFPLQIRANGQWAKKVRGHLVTFGSVLEVAPAEALRRYHDHMSDVLAGRRPRAADPNVVTVGRLWEAYARDCMRRVESGKLSSAAAGRYCSFLEATGSALGADRAVRDLGPADFLEMRRRLEARGWAPTTLKGALTVVQQALNWAVDDAALITAKPATGRALRHPSKNEVRRFRAGRGIRGRMLFDAPTARALFDRANPMLRPAILLALNGGFGQSDLASLPWSAVDLEERLIRFPRPKTGVQRLVPLWDETAAELRRWQEQTAAKPREPEAEGLVFVTRFGLPIRRVQLSTSDDRVRTVVIDAVGDAFARLLVKVGVKAGKGEPSRSAGVGFYTLRHTFITVARGAGHDPMHVRVIAGHVTDDNVADEYVEDVPLAALHAVASSVRDWFRSGDGGSRSSGADADPAQDPGPAPADDASAAPPSG